MRPATTRKPRLLVIIGPARGPDSRRLELDDAPAARRARGRARRARRARDGDRDVDGDRGGAPRRARPVAPLELLQALLELRVLREERLEPRVELGSRSPSSLEVEGRAGEVRAEEHQRDEVHLQDEHLQEAPVPRRAICERAPTNFPAGLVDSGGIRNVTLAMFVRRGLQLGEPESAARCSDAESPSSAAAPRRSSHPNGEDEPE